MGRLTTMILIMSGIMLLFYFLGLIQNTITSSILNFLLNPETFNTSPLWIKIVAGVEGIVGLFTTIVGLVQKNDLIVSIPVALFLLNLIFDFLSLFTVLYAASTILAVMIFGPLTLVYILTVYEWWRGIST